MGFISILSLSALFLVISAGTAQAERVLFPCGYDYLSTAGAWFKMHTQDASWVIAHTTCISEGARLASPTINKNAMAMRALMQLYLNGTHPTLGRAVHTSIRPGDKIINLDTANPSFAFTEEGTLGLVPEGYRLPYFCYKKESHVLTLNECGSTAPGYKLDKRTDRCYKFHRNRKSWTSAAQMCETQGGDLAIINSEEEAKVIKEIFAQNPKDVIPGNLNNFAFLGFLADDMGFWQTLQPQTLSAAGYEDWAPGRPKNNGSISCGSVGRDGKLYDISCKTHLPFICELEINRCN